MGEGGIVFVEAQPTPPNGGRLLLLLDLVRHISGMTYHGGGGGGELVFKKDCTDLVRRVSLLTHFVEELSEEDMVGPCTDPSSSENTVSCWWSGSDLLGALQAAKRLLVVATKFKSTSNNDGAARKIKFRFQCVTWKLERALATLPLHQCDISEEVKDQVELVRSQLRRATERYGAMDSRMVSFALAQPVDKEVMQVEKGNRLMRGRHIIEKVGYVDHGVTEVSGSKTTTSNTEINERNPVSCNLKQDSDGKGVEELKKADAVIIPEDFLCPISLELMRDPIIVATGQTYERAYIQRWIDTGNKTCPKTRQELAHLTLTPNYVLKGLISQWCTEHNVEQPSKLTNGKLKSSDGFVHDVNDDVTSIQTLVRKLSSQFREECRSAVTEIRSLSKRSTDNRILIAEAGAIPVLVNLLTAEDVVIQENAVTAILNLSICESNRGIVMLAGAIPSIVQILRAGSMEARENAAATLFSLSMADENKIIIGTSGAIPALVDLLENGSRSGKKDAATALFNLCIYQGNKGRAVRAGIVPALLKILMNSTTCMVDEALTILSVLASNQAAKLAIVKAKTIPILIDMLRTGQPRTKENATAILLSLCKKDRENLTSISRLGAVIPLSEIVKSGTQRAMRKASSLLEHLKKLQVR